MKVLTTSTETQTLKVIPRVFTRSVSMELKDDSTNTIISLIPNAVKVGNYIELSTIFNLKEGRFYDLKLIDLISLKIIYKDKIFCTDQAINQTTNSYYSVNKDTYISAPSDNDYIIS